MKPKASRRGKKKKQVETAKHSAPLRHALKQLYKKWVTSEADRRALSNFLGQSVTSLSNLARGEGSLNTWWSLVLWKTGLKPEELTDLFYQAVKKHVPPSLADQEWNALDTAMTQNEKLYWVRVIAVASRVDSTLRRQKK